MFRKEILSERDGERRAVAGEFKRSPTPESQGQRGGPFGYYEIEQISNAGHGPEVLSRSNPRDQIAGSLRVLQSVSIAKLSILIRRRWFDINGNRAIVPIQNFFYPYPL